MLLTLFCSLAILDPRVGHTVVLNDYVLYKSMHSLKTDSVSRGWMSGVTFGSECVIAVLVIHGAVWTASAIILESFLATVNKNFMDVLSPFISVILTGSPVHVLMLHAWSSSPACTWHCWLAECSVTCPGCVHNVQHRGTRRQLLYDVTWQRCSEGDRSAVQIHWHRHCSLRPVLLWNATSQLTWCEYNTPV